MQKYKVSLDSFMNKVRQKLDPDMSQYAATYNYDRIYIRREFCLPQIINKKLNESS